MSPQAKQRYLQEIWDRIPACTIVYRDNFHAFLEDVSREENLLLNPPPPPLELEVERLIPTSTPQAWEAAEAGYDLASIRDAVLAEKRHFPSGVPNLGPVCWMDRASRQYFGFWRYSDDKIVVNPALNSPDVPLFVIEFILYHELLHSDMPYAGHNADFKARERLFQPSPEAIKLARQDGIKPAITTGTWRARAYGFLRTFEKHWVIGEPGSTVSL